MSTHICGCDPEAGHRCEQYPTCPVGRDDQQRGLIFTITQEHRLRNHAATPGGTGTVPSHDSDIRSIRARCFACGQEWGDHDYNTGRCPGLRGSTFMDTPPPFKTPSPTRGHSVEEVKKFRAEMFEKSMSLIDQKGADYNRDQQNSGDTLFNLRVCELLGIVPSAEEGVLVRLSDKFMRLISLTKPGREAAVKDESVLDTVRDIHNYIDYLALMWLRRRGL